MMKPHGYKQWACLLGFVGTLSCSLAQSVSSLRIGLIGPMTGPSADFGVPMINGAELALDEINAAGGYLGRRMELVIKDDTGNPNLGQRRDSGAVCSG